jgi:GTP-binding protein
VHFIDEAKIWVKAGDGGNGCIAFRREAHVPRGGPSGGDGGNGGNVVLLADTQLGTLLDFKYKRHYKARRGEDGRTKDQYGAAGEDLILRVPVGTVVHDADSDETLGDLSDDGARLVIAQGGKGGRGNIHFATPWNQAPRQAEDGTKGSERNLRLELKLLADVGLLGYPSVGKSTFIAKVSRARPKIADYPFTTLVPNLGVVKLGPERTLVVADIPGLIEGAADGAGLGHRFLRHVERTAILIHILEASVFTGPDRDPAKDFETINGELAKYAPELAEKPQIVVVNKCDLTETQDALEDLRAAFEARGHTLLAMSAATGEGVREVLEATWTEVHKARAARAADPR